MNGMQATNRPGSQKSRCMYCGSPNRGKGCRYGPHGVHFHPDDSTKCAYCGSPNYGRGCKINPTNDLHIHGVTYNNMFREFIQNFINNKVLLKELTKPFKEFDAYKFGIINECGQRIKEPKTLEEHNSFCSLTKTLLKIKRFVGSKIDLINATGSLTESSKLNKNQTERYKVLLEHKDKIADNINELYKIIDEAKESGLTLEEIFGLLET
jgi:hypothetical protein